MANFDFTSNFNACPAGAMPTSSKVLAWAGTPITTPLTTAGMDEDTAGHYFSILSGGGKIGGNCQRLFFPQGSYGLTPGNCQRYTLTLGNPGCPVNLEWDYYFEPGYDLSQSGKVGPGIMWGPSSGTLGGVFSGFWWRNGNAPGTIGLEVIAQNQRRGSPLPAEFATTGAQGFTGSQYTTTIPVAQMTGVWWHLRIQMMGGPNGWCKWWVNDTLLATLDSTSPAWTLTNVNDPVLIFMAAFFGGGASYAAKNDSYSRQDNVRIYTTSTVDGVSIMPTAITVGVPKTLRANFTVAGTPIVPTSQVVFTSADPTKLTVAPVAGTFDQFVATPLGAGSDGSPVNVAVHCALAGSPTYSSFAGDPAVTLNAQLVDLVTLTIVS